VSAVTVRFLGSGDAFGSGGRFQACILMDWSDGQALLDCGASSLIAMRRFGVEPAGIDAILISHLHGDHFGGLPFFLLEAQLISRRTRPLVIAGPPGIEARLRAAMEVLFPGSSRTAQRFPLEFLELPERVPTRVGALGVTALQVVHESGAPSYALRVECGGRVLGYSGDTEWTDALLEVARGADLFVCEAYVFGRRIRYHLDYATLAARREALGCRRLVLTHMSAEMLARVDGLDVETASDGLSLAV
jgi:ribonuclease BN (tRNA processing enzyme)